MPTLVFRRALRVAVVCALPLSLLAASGGVSKESITLDGKRHEYFLFVPDRAAGSGPPPMLMLLHGSGHDGRSLVDPWKKLAEQEGLILVAPSSQNPALWQSPVDGPQALISIANAVKEKYGADPNRIYLFGHSAGAVFSLYLSAWQPRYFAAIAIHAGSTTAEEESELRKVLPDLPRKTPIQIQVGTRDPFFPLRLVRATRDIFTAAGFTIDLREIPGHDHNYYVVSDRINREAWAFLRDKRLR
jgi:poly(3-hydroxybutyrate) depolymerase